MIVSLLFDVSAEAPALDQLDSIQVLRALAALLVMWLHMQGAYAALVGWSPGSWVPVGSGGVDLFFTISGFIICHTARKRPSAGTFLAHRAARIVPLYWTVTIAIYVTALVAPNLMHSTTSDPLALVKSLLFIPYVKNSGLVQPIHMLGWTLNYEIFFYGLFGLALMVSRRPVVWVCVGLVGLVGLRTLLPHPGVVAHFYTDSLVLEFVWGCLIYGLYRHAPRVLWALRWVWPVGLVLLIGQNYVDTGLPRAIVQGIPAALVVAGLIPLRIHPNTGWMRPLLVIGDASYSLYLLHPMVMRAFDLAFSSLGVSKDVRIMVGLPLMVGVSLGLAVMSYRLFERPVLRLLKGWMAQTRSGTRSSTRSGTRSGTLTVADTRGGLCGGSCPPERCSPPV